jgi:hypothetical protein
MFSWADHVARVEMEMNEETTLVRQLEEKRPRRTWNDTMKTVGKIGKTVPVPN